RKRRASHPAESIAHWGRTSNRAARPFTLGRWKPIATRRRSGATRSPWNGRRAPVASRSFPKSIAPPGFRSPPPARRFTRDQPRSSTPSSESSAPSDPAIEAEAARPYVSPMRRWLIILCITLLVAGLLWPLLQKIGLGRLPGDIVIERENVRFY